jgi:aldose 1-epimerase
MDIQPFGFTTSGQPAQIFTLSGAEGFRARITNYGGVLVNLFAPDREGALADVVLGFDTLEEYITLSKFFGCLVGRFANRIAQGRFELNGTVYELARNGGPNHIHGGPVGFDKVVWQAEAETTDGHDTLVLRHHSPDGDQGYPGAIDVQVTYTVKDRSLHIDYRAQCDAPTILNLTNHTYFNLAGRGHILDHVMTLHADAYTPVDDALIPTGELAAVEGTPFDFRTPTPIGARIDADHPQIRNGLGYDHNFVLNRAGDGLVDVVRVVSPTSGRTLDVATTEPGLQFYTGNFLDGSITGRSGVVYQRRQGFCLETQHFPDSPNKPQFPSTLLRPGETYRSTTVYRFGTI